MATGETIFREYRVSDAERSDRSAGDRLRHRQKVRESIRENIADIAQCVILSEGCRSEESRIL